MTNFLTIDLDVIGHNYEALKAFSGGAVCAAAVKANAYGVGAREVTEVLVNRGCTSVFVAYLEEALEIQDLIEPGNIHILHGVNETSAGEIAARGFVPVLNTERQIKIWRTHATQNGNPLPAALHFDTGINRMGLKSVPDDISGIDLKLVMSHLSSSDEPDCPENIEQRGRFIEAAASYPGVPRSLANSRGVLLGASYHFDMVRPGRALYGVESDLGLKNPFSWQAEILQIKEIQAGETVGYNRTYTATDTTQVATASVGYADGYLTTCGNKACFYYKGYELPVIGKVSMDLTCIDIAGLPDNFMKEGDFVDVLNPQATLDTYAHQFGLHEYEVITSMARRFPRRYLNASHGL